MNNRLSEKIKIKSSNINILRFICAIAVIICHSYAVTAGEEDFVSRYTGGQCNLGGVAVAVFFFLSGLYVSKSLDRTDSAWVFIKKRCDRIFPSLWTVVILSVILAVFLCFHLIMKGDRSRKAEEEEALQLALAQLKEEEKDLKNQLSIVGTEEYIVSSARENYSFLKKDEIRFEFSNPEALYTYSEEELRILVDEMAD